MKVLSAHSGIVINLLPITTVDIIRLYTSAAVEIHAGAFFLRDRGLDRLYLFNNAFKLGNLFWLSVTARHCDESEML